MKKEDSKNLLIFNISIDIRVYFKNIVREEKIFKLTRLHKLVLKKDAIKIVGLLIILLICFLNMHILIFVEQNIEKFEYLN